MNSNNEIRYFTAVTYDNNIYHFILTKENEIFCIEFAISTPAKVFELKPNFVLRDKSSRTIYSLDDYRRENNVEKSLIKEFIIDDDLFEYLMNKRMLMYSTDMAFLYGFDPLHAYDAYKQTRAFKSYRNNPKKRTKILEKQKKGIFHEPPKQEFY